MTDVVAVEHVGEVAELHQGVLQREGDRALARARQAGEPDRRSLLLQQGGPLLARDVPLVPGDVGRLVLGRHRAVSPHLAFAVSSTLLVYGRDAGASRAK